MIGTDELARLWKEEGIGFAVYKAELLYSEGVEFGETIDVRSTYILDSEYRMIWTHEAWKSGGKKPAVSCTLHLVCLDRNKKLMPIPPIDT